MKTLIRKTFFYLLIVLAFTSCEKEKTTILSVSAKTESGEAVTDVSVRIYPEQEIKEQYITALSKTSTSDVEGIAEFDYSSFFEEYNEGFILLRVEGTKGSQVAKGWIDLREGARTEAELFFE